MIKRAIKLWIPSFIRKVDECKSIITFFNTDKKLIQEYLLLEYLGAKVSNFPGTFQGKI